MTGRPSSAAGTTAAGDLAARVRRLEDVEEIRLLKARYFRGIDTKDWQMFGDVFTDDAELRLRGLTWNGRDDIVAWASAAMSGGVSAHQGHMPEITIVDHRSATGVWALHDVVQRGDGSGFEGFGFYYETYRRTDDRWRIATCEVKRLRVDTLSNGLPDTQLPHPPELQ